MTALQDVVAARREFLAIVDDPNVAQSMLTLLSEKEQQRFSSAHARLSGGEVIVTIVGRQGVGKSSLLNAMLFCRRTLPIDETETTNVVSLIRGIDELGERAEVRFQNGSVEKGPLNDTFLRQFTDEQQNCGNEKYVAQIDCFTDSPLLRDGLTFADTPGVGSLTGYTEDVTKGFLKNIGLGIFLISATPTLLDSESRFLRQTWSFTGNFIFVQNIWGESDRNRQQAYEDNLTKLQAIAKEEQYDGAVSLISVDVHAALEGACNNDQRRRDASGLPALIHEVQRRLADGASRFLLLSEGHCISSLMHNAAQSGASRLAGLVQKDSVDDKTAIEREHEAHTRLDAIGDDCRRDRGDFKTQVDRLLDTFVEELESDLEGAESSVVGMAESRQVHAEHLNLMLRDKLALAVSKPSKRLQHDYSRTVEAFRAKAVSHLGEIRESVQGKVVDLGALPQDLRWTERGETAGKHGVHLGEAALVTMAGVALWAGGAAIVAGEGIAAAVAAASAAVPGIGWVVAGCVLIAGWGLKKGMESRALTKLVQGIRSAVGNTRRQVVREVRKQVGESALEMERALDELLRAEIEQQRKVLADIHDDRRRTTEERTSLTQILQEQLRVLSGAQRRMSMILQGVEQS